MTQLLTRHQINELLWNSTVAALEEHCCRVEGERVNIFK